MITLPAPDERTTRLWVAVFELHERMPKDWTLVGGQMVLLHCIERGTFPVRATNDLDAVLDVRANAHVLLDFTSHLQQVGFKPTGTSPQGHQHRWVRDDVSIDVMIPRHVGERAARRTGVTRATTLETPGAQQALNRSATVEMLVAGRNGQVNRPSLLGSLVAKAAAHTVLVDPGRDRHLLDFVTLAALVTSTDGVQRATRRDRYYLEGMLGALTHRPDVVASVSGGAEGVQRVRQLVQLAQIHGNPSLVSQPTPQWARQDQTTRHSRTDVDSIGSGPGLPSE